MEIKGKVHCFFEQSGTFKNEFIKLGIPAEDYDIQNNFGETDHVIDLFVEIEKAYEGGGKSIFDNITQEDLIVAFFPCIYFETTQMMYFDDTTINLRALSGKERYDVILERLDNRNTFHKLLYKLYALCKFSNKRLIIENPATQPNFLVGTQNFPKPSLIDRNRTMRGDYFVKPTAYWYVNCSPTYGCSCQNDKERKTIMNARSAPRAGLCSEERSMISPDYARNFICDFIIGKKQPNIYPTLFD